MQSDQTPMVSILVPTYNHAEYIEDCLNGISLQVCNFDLEIVFCDDGSTDRTVDILQEFQSKANLNIQAVLRENNVGMNANVLDGLQKCMGKYIAICEGDDFWTNPLKLQQQVDFMEANEEYAICFHPVEIKDFISGETIVSNISTQKITTLDELSKGNYIHTTSVLLKNFGIEYPDWMYRIEVPDYGIFMLNATQGNIRMLMNTMAVYRKHQTGIWSQLKDFEMREKIVSYLLTMKDKFDPRTNQNLQKRLEIILASLVKEYAKKIETLEKFNVYFELLAAQNIHLSQTVHTQLSSQKHEGIFNLPFFSRFRRNS